jgi:hypothetical protein
MPHPHASRLITLLVVIAVGFGTFSLLSDDAVPQAQTDPTRQAVPTPQSPDYVAKHRSRHMRGSKEVSHSGVLLVVPRYWGTDRVTRCGGLLADTVIYPAGNRLACALTSGCCPTQKLQHSSVQFVSAQFRDAGSLRAGSGVPSTGAVQRGPVRRSGGGYVQSVDVPSRDLRVIVRSPYESLVEQLSGSVQLTGP